MSGESAGSDVRDAEADELDGCANWILWTVCMVALIAMVAHSVGERNDVCEMWAAERGDTLALAREVEPCKGHLIRTMIKEAL